MGRPERHVREQSLMKALLRSGNLTLGNELERGFVFFPGQYFVVDTTRFHRSVVQTLGLGKARAPGNDKG
jgi:hypothetical protein